MKVPKPQNHKKGYKRTIQNRKLTVLERDGYKCVSCKESDLEVLSIDHKIPKKVMRKLGYGCSAMSRAENLQIMCLNCQARKRDKVSVKDKPLLNKYKEEKELS